MTNEFKKLNAPISLIPNLKSQTTHALDCLLLLLLLPASMMQELGSSQLPHIEQDIRSSPVQFVLFVFKGLSL